MPKAKVNTLNLRVKDLVKRDLELKARVDKKVPKIITTLVDKYGIKQRDLAETLGCTQQYLCNVKNGKAFMSYKLYLKLERTLNIVSTMKGKML